MTKRPSASAGRKTATAPRRPAVVRIRVRIPSTKEAIRDVVRKVMRAAVDLRCGQAQKADIEIAFREALANAVFHGNQGDPTKKVTVRCSLSREQGLMLAVRDEGAGFDPTTIPDPRTDDRIFLHHGRGLLLMRELMDRVEHRHGGREVLLFKEPCVRRAASSRRR